MMCGVFPELLEIVECIFSAQSYTILCRLFNVYIMLDYYTFWVQRVLVCKIYRFSN